MISAHRDRAELHEAVFQYALDLINKSGAASAIDEAADRSRGPGGRPGSKEIVYTTKAVLVAIVCLLDLRLQVSAAAVFELLFRWCTPSQRERLGVVASPQSIASTADRSVANREYFRFSAWLSRRLLPLDSLFDITARVTTNKKRDRILAERTAEDRAAAAAALMLCDRIVNDIVAASIGDPCPRGYAGDLLVDETTLQTSQSRPGMGNQPHHKRAAAPAARIYVRSKGVVSDDPDRPGQKVTKSGAGVGVTALTRIGPPTRIRAVPRAITSIIVREPTSANLHALDLALENHVSRGFDPRARKPLRGANARWPRLIGDMGYNVKKGWPDVLYRHRFSAVSRYPVNWPLTHGTQHPRSDTGVRTDPGPVQVEGVFYCPAVLQANQHRLAIPISGMSAKDLDTHDERIKARLQYAMGTNGRITKAAPTRGRPSKTEPAEDVFKIALICPAVQGRADCLFRPNPEIDPAVHPTIRPDWEPERYECCIRSHVTVTMTERQAREYQPLPAGSWEHALIFESGRALTENGFSLLKSPYLTGLNELSAGPRREPFMKLLIGIAIALTNRQLAQHQVSDEDSYSERLGRIRAAIGREPFRVPPRT